MHNTPSFYEAPKVLIDPGPKRDIWMEEMMSRVCRPVVRMFPMMIYGSFEPDNIDDTIKKLRKLQAWIEGVDPGV